MLFLLPHFLSCLILFICVSSQYFENPGVNSRITCGLIESCYIICNSANSCESSEFYLYSNDAYIECSGQSSCQSLKIFSINTTSLTLYFNESNAFRYGIAYIQQSNSNITTQCLKPQSCAEASFYYNGVGQTVEHYCNGIGSCNGALISALATHVIYIECDGNLACNKMDIYTPINTFNTSIINVNGIISSTHIYSIHGMTNINIICNGECNNRLEHDIYIIYGIDYQSYCAIYDPLCMESMDINNVAFEQNENIAIIYHSDGDYNGLVLNDTKILLFIFHSQIINQTLNVVKPSQSSSFIHVICVDYIHYPSCNNIHFNFSLTNHAIITANNADSITIIGPTDDYTRIAHRDNNNNNQYHLQSTSNILLQCNHLKGGQCLNNSSLYTGSTTNVTVLCGSNDCHHSTIYSDINPTQTTLSLGNSGFNIICYASNTSCTPQFKLHFANNITCDTPNDPNCINFLSSSPTINPTISPITSSPSVSPSYNPSVSPSYNPSISPSFKPSISPSYNPSVSPSYNPSISPSYNPSISPSYNPSISPSYNPSISPSFKPSITPTKSPSHNPTYNPSTTPTNNPSQYPTHIPSIYPTFSPTYSPSKAPTLSPTSMPTIAPTSTPTKNPTSAPTSSPSFAPSSAPSQPPTSVPTIAPSLSPTLAPVQPPTNAPTLSPSLTPTSAPTQPPTNAPTFSPTNNPTNAPTHSPTKNPTFTPTHNPTNAPTMYPTADIYQYILHVDFTLTNITFEIFMQLHNETLRDELEYRLAQSYVLYSRKVVDDSEQYLHYKYFDLQIIQVLPESFITQSQAADANMKNWRNYSTLLKSDIRYEDVSVGTDIHFVTRLNGFENFTESKLRDYFDHDEFLTLEISQPELDDNDKVRITPDIKGFIIVILIVGGICTLTSITSFIYNNWIPKAVTDNGNSFAPPLYGLQIIDFFSDINLCVEMFLELKGSRDEEDNISLYIATWGTLAFALIPYATNLAMATNIKSIKEINNNPFAKSYFQTTSWFFIVLAVFSGGVYPSLSIVSSRLFGYEFLNSGLTMMEMTRLTKLRFFGTILLENIPQLCFSILYINYLGKMSYNTILSMVMSILQILSVVLNYIVVRRPTDCRVIQYDLEMKVGANIKTNTEGFKSPTLFASTSIISMDGDDTDNESDEQGNNEAISCNVLEIDTPSTLTKAEKQLIRNKKERKHSLRQWLCQELSLQVNAMEIGYVTLTPNGCIVHIIHYTFESEAKQFRDLRKKQKRSSPMIPPIDSQVGHSNTHEIELENIQETDVIGTSCEQIALKAAKSLSIDNFIMAKSRSYERWDGDEKSFEKTAKSLFKSLYKRNADRVNCAFASHFGFEQEKVMVTYHKNYTYSDWEVMNKRNFSYHNLENIYESDHEIRKGGTVSKRVMENNTNQTDSQSPAQSEKIRPKMHIDISNRSAREDSKSCASHTPTEEMKVGLEKMEELSKRIIDKLGDKEQDEVVDELLEEGYDAQLIDKIMYIGKYMSAVRIKLDHSDSDGKGDDEADSDGGIENIFGESDTAEQSEQSEQSENISDNCDESDESECVDIKMDEVKTDCKTQEKDELKEVENIHEDDESSLSKGNDTIETEILPLSDDTSEEDTVNDNKCEENEMIELAELNGGIDDTSEEETVNENKCDEDKNEKIELVDVNSDMDEEDKENIEGNIVDEDTMSGSDINENESIEKHVDENVSNQQNVDDRNVTDNTNKQHPS